MTGRPDCDAGENAGPSRGQALVELIAERVDLAEQTEDLVV